MQKVSESGRGALRENPARSLHWELEQEHQMLAPGLWLDSLYAGCECNFIGARCKRQRLRHNIPEVSQWPVVHGMPSHVHDQRNGIRCWWMGRGTTQAKKRRSTPHAYSVCVIMGSQDSGIGMMAIPQDALS